MSNQQRSRLATRSTWKGTRKTHKRKDLLTSLRSKSRTDGCRLRTVGPTPCTLLSASDLRVPNPTQLHPRRVNVTGVASTEAPFYTRFYSSIYHPRSANPHPSLSMVNYAAPPQSVSCPANPPSQSLLNMHLGIVRTALPLMLIFVISHQSLE